MLRVRARGVAGMGRMGSALALSSFCSCNLINSPTAKSQETHASVGSATHQTRATSSARRRSSSSDAASADRPLPVAWGQRAASSCARVLPQCMSAVFSLPSSNECIRIVASCNERLPRSFCANVDLHALAHTWLSYQNSAERTCPLSLLHGMHACGIPKQASLGLPDRMGVADEGT